MTEQEITRLTPEQLAALSDRRLHWIELKLYATALALAMIGLLMMPFAPLFGRQDLLIRTGDRIEDLITVAEILGREDARRIQPELEADRARRTPETRSSGW